MAGSQLVIKQRLCVNTVLWLRNFVRVRCRPDDWFEFLCSCYVLQCRPELHRVFKYSCQCLPPKAKITSQFVVPMPDLGPDEEVFHSCISSIQLAYKTVPNVSSHFRDPRSISRVFRLIERGRDLLDDRKFSVWNFLKGSGPRRVRFQSKLESASFLCRPRCFCFE